MSYDFCLLQLRRPCGVEFPMDMETWGGDDPNSMMIRIDDPDRFWHQLSCFFGMEQNGPADLRTWRFRSSRKPGFGFLVYPTYNYTEKSTKTLIDGFQRMLNECSEVGWVVKQLTDLNSLSAAQGLLGIKLDMAGSWYDVLDLYRHIRQVYPLLVIIDQQTGMAYDEVSFLRRINEASAP